MAPRPIDKPAEPWLFFLLPSVVELDRTHFPALRPIGLDVAARDRADSAADIVIGIVGQIGERNTYAPVRCIETAAVEQHDGVIVGQLVDEVERKPGTKCRGHHR